jgi:hypothetical protein
MGDYRASNIAVAQVSISTLAPSVHNTAPEVIAWPNLGSYCDMPPCLIEWKLVSPRAI